MAEGGSGDSKVMGASLQSPTEPSMNASKEQCSPWILKDPGDVGKET